MVRFRLHASVRLMGGTLGGLGRTYTRPMWCCGSLLGKLWVVGIIWPGRDAGLVYSHSLVPNRHYPGKEMQADS